MAVAAPVNAEFATEDTLSLGGICRRARRCC